MSPLDVINDIRERCFQQSLSSESMPRSITDAHVLSFTPVAQLMTPVELQDTLTHLTTLTFSTRHPRLIPLRARVIDIEYFREHGNYQAAFNHLLYACKGLITEIDILYAASTVQSPSTTNQE